MRNREHQRYGYLLKYGLFSISYLARGLSLESPDNSYSCRCLFNKFFFSYLFFFYFSQSFHDRSVQDNISNNIENVISLHPFANIFVVGDIMYTITGGLITLSLAALASNHTFINRSCTGSLPDPFKRT